MTSVSELTFQGEKGRDEFRRELVADKVIQLLTSDIDVSPMVIDGSWGTGKTEFCHKLINKFRASHENYRLLYVDAFQADHADHPLMTVLSAVMTLLPEGKEKKTLLQKALPVMRYSLATMLKAIVSHTLKQNADDIADGLDKHLQDAADKAIDASVTALLKDHEKAQENLKALQRVLESIADNAPIVIFIDELDRCRPDFAVQMLEVIKHTFNVKDVKFVLVTNTQQIRAAINHCYGSQVDAQRYLDKFLKFSFQIPDFSLGQRGNEIYWKLAAVEHFSGLLKESPVLKGSAISPSKDGGYEFAKELIERHRLSLREVETFVRHLEIYHRLSDGLSTNTVFGYQLLRIIAVLAFCFFKDAAVAIRRNRVEGDQLAALFGFDGPPDFISQTHGSSHVDIIFMLLIESGTIKIDRYQIPDQIQEKLVDIERSYFSGWGFRGDNKFGPIKDVIATLSFEGG